MIGYSDVRGGGANGPYLHAYLVHVPIDDNIAMLFTGTICFNFLSRIQEIA